MCGIRVTHPSRAVSGARFAFFHEAGLGGAGERLAVLVHRLRRAGIGLALFHKGVLRGAGERLAIGAHGLDRAGANVLSERRTAKSKNRERGNESDAFHDASPLSGSRASLRIPDEPRMTKRRARPGSRIITFS